MWLHLPNECFPSAQDTGELNLDSEALSLLAQSATWKTKSVSQASWRRAWKTAPSIRHLSGLTSPPSILSRGVERWIASLGASRASRSRSRDNSAGPTTNGTSGPTSPDSLNGLGFQTSFWKTSPESSGTTGTPYDPNYKRWATALRKDSSRRQKQAHLTGGNGSLSWRTPGATDGEDGVMEMRPNTTGHYKLRDHAAHWMTPNTMDALPPKSQQALDHEHDTVGKRPEVAEQPSRSGGGAGRHYALADATEQGLQEPRCLRGRDEPSQETSAGLDRRPKHEGSELADASDQGLQGLRRCREETPNRGHGTYTYLSPRPRRPRRMGTNAHRNAGGSTHFLPSGSWACPWGGPTTPSRWERRRSGGGGSCLQIFKEGVRQWSRIPNVLPSL